MISSLYIHVPFCAHKCEYCAFYSEAAAGELINRYVDALVRELEMIADQCSPRTVFFGGGTPSLLNLRQWETILGAMGRLNLLGAHEFTIEANPATVSLDKAKLLRDFGVNRVSMGVQSLDETLLDRLGRVHSRQMVFTSYDILRQAGFENINLDLMFAIPTQTREMWRDTLRETIAMQSEHLSSYEVIYEEDTPLFAQLNAGEFSVDEDLACGMYDELVATTSANGFRQYEIANFARDKNPVAAVPTFACAHNVNYWRGGEFLGLGPSATAYVAGVRAKNWSNARLYCERLEAGKRAIESHEELSPLKRAGEIAAFGLRMPAGWRFDEFQQTTGFDLRSEWSDAMDEASRNGWGLLDKDKFCLTAAGLRFADAAGELFLK